MQIISEEPQKNPPALDQDMAGLAPHTRHAFQLNSFFDGQIILNLLVRAG